MVVELMHEEEAAGTEGLPEDTGYSGTLEEASGTLEETDSTGVLEETEATGYSGVLEETATGTDAEGVSTG
jgi:hypothetical protein